MKIAFKIETKISFPKYFISTGLILLINRINKQRTICYFLYYKKKIKNLEKMAKNKIKIEYLKYLFEFM